MGKVKVYIKEYIGEFESQEKAEEYLAYERYNFDEDTQPLFVEVEEN